jgi:lipopolysaccharide heptosyltransferase II
MPAGFRGPLLLRLPNWVGDLVLALPVIQAAATPEGGRPLLLLGPAPFGSILVPRFPGARYLAWTRASRYALLAPLRRERPDTALLLTESFSSALLVALAGVPERIGFAAEGRSFLLTVRILRPRPARSTARAAEYRRLASAAGIDVREEDPALEARGPEREAAAHLLASLGRGGTPYAVIAPGASYGPAKRWSAERFAEAARHLREAWGLAAVLVGSEEDREAAEGLAALAPGAASAVGRTDLPALLGLLAEAAVVLSNDSGVMHLAAALRRPTVAVFGSTSPVWTSASAPWVSNLYAGYPCSPCFRRTCAIGYGCLRSVTAAHVTAALDGLLTRGSAARRAG